MILIIIMAKFLTTSFGSVSIGAPPTNVTAKQNGLNTVMVTWTPPLAPPAAGYQVQVTVSTITTTTNVTGNSHNISVNNNSVYSIRVMSLSQHLPSKTTAPVEVTARGKL